MSKPAKPAFWQVVVNLDSSPSSSLAFFVITPNGRHIPDPHAGFNRWSEAMHQDDCEVKNVDSIRNIGWISSHSLATTMTLDSSFIDVQGENDQQ